MQIDNLDWHAGKGVLGSIAVVLFRMQFLCGVYGVKEMLDTTKELKSLLWEMLDTIKELKYLLWN